MGCVVSSEVDSPRGGSRHYDDQRHDPHNQQQQHKQQQHHLAPNGAAYGECVNGVGHQLPALGVPAPPDARKTHDPNELARRKTAKKKRVAIAVEALLSSADIRPVPKSEQTTRLILAAVKDNPLFDGLNEETRIVLVSTMARMEIPAGQDIITQGDENAVSAAPSYSFHEPTTVYFKRCITCSLACLGSSDQCLDQHRVR